MIRVYKPKLEDLWFKQKMLADEETMSYNHAYGGTIDFSKDRWEDWYERWILFPKSRYYRYLIDDTTNEFVGEIAYHLEENYLIDVVIYAPYRHQGFGRTGLKLLCEEADRNGITDLYDELAIDNTSIDLFIKEGFEVISKKEEIIIHKKLPGTSANDWKFVTSAIDNDAFDGEIIFGVNIFRYQWIDTYQTIVLKDPQYGTSRHLKIYSVNIDGQEHEFAAGEFSNSIYGFYVHK